MTAFACRTRNASGEVVEKRIEANSEREAMSQLEKSGLFPVRISAVVDDRDSSGLLDWPDTANHAAKDTIASLVGSASGANNYAAKTSRKKAKVSRKDLMQFSLQLGSSLDAGMPILQGVASSIQLTRNVSFQRVLGSICTDIESGLTLSESMARHPEVFPHAYVGTVAAGEKSGMLEDMLENLVEFLEADMEMRGDIRSAIMYPAIVVVTLCLAIVVLIAFVVPRFTAFYAGFDTQLPLATRVLISTSAFMENHYGFLIVAAIGSIFVFKRLLRIPQVSAMRDRFVLRIPILGEMIETAVTLEIVQLLGLFTKAGVPILEAIESAAQTTGNAKYRHDLRSVAAGILGGQTFAAGMESVSCFPLEARHMLANGEATGSLERACNSTAKRYKKELSYKTKTLATLIEPLLTLVLAVIVLFIALAVFLPMWDLVSVVGN